MFNVPDKKQLAEKALNVAVKCCKENKTQEAELVLNQLIKVDPKNYNALLLLGILAHKKHQYKEAIELYMKALAVEPNSPETHNNIALSYSSLGQFEIAINHLKKAIDKKPDATSYWGNLGLSYRQCRKWKESEKAFKKALELSPEDVHMWLNLGGLKGDQQDLNGAIECFQMAISIDPYFHAGHVDLAYALALKGEWKNSWYHYEHRLACFQQCRGIYQRYNPQKMWNCEDLTGKILVIWCEQGIGDIFNFVRFIPKIKGADKVILEVPQSCHDLLKNNGFKVSLDASKEDYDYHCSLMSLPSLLDIDDLSSSPYLGADFDRDIGNKKSVRVGVCWAGNPQHPYDSTRSFQLSRLKPLNDIDRVVLYSLQKDIRKRVYANKPEDEVNLAEGCENMPIISSFIQSSKDFADTARIIESLDIVVTADTSILHLAGAMGKKVFAMIPKHCDWRWTIEGETTIWYPTVTLIRSNEFGEWGDAFDRLKSHLIEAVAQFPPV